MTSITNGINSYYRNYALNQLNSATTNPISNLLKISVNSGLNNQSSFNSYDPRLSDYFNALTKNTYMLKTVASSLHTLNYNASFNQKSVTAANSTVITGTATNKAYVRDYTVNIKNLAQNQINTGAKLISNDRTTNSGLNSFSINFGSGNSKKIFYTLNDTDTNKTSLDKMAKAVNDSNSGIKASVVNDTKDGTSYITLEGETGAKNSFTIQDIQGKAAVSTNINNITTIAKDAQLTVDGKEYTSSDNSVSLNNNRVVLNFSKAEGKDITVSVGADTSAVKDSIKSLVKNYNNLVNFASQNETEFSGANTLNNELGSVVSSKKTSLQSIGITVNSDNTLTIDEKKLDKSLKDNFSKVKDIISGNGSLTSKLDGKTNEIIANQYKYAKGSDTSSYYTDINTYFSSGTKLSYLQNQNLNYIINTMA